MLIETFKDFEVVYSVVYLVPSDLAALQGRNKTHDIH